MSEAERFCDEKATIIVPGIALNYDGNMLESVGIGGEMFRRETPLSAENRLLRAENAKLRESVRNLLTCVKHEECEESCPYYEPMYNDYGYEKNGSTVVESEYLGCCAAGLENCNSTLFDTDEYLRELGIEVE